MVASEISPVRNRSDYVGFERIQSLTANLFELFLSADAVVTSASASDTKYRSPLCVWFKSTQHHNTRERKRSAHHNQTPTPDQPQPPPPTAVLNTATHNTAHYDSVCTISERSGHASLHGANRPRRNQVSTTYDGDLHPAIRPIKRTLPRPKNSNRASDTVKAS